MLRKIGAFFTEEKIVGIDIGYDYITAASVSSGNNHTTRIDSFGYIEKRPEASKNATALLIKKLWRNSHIKSHTVYSCLRSPSLVLKYFKFPDLSASELESALELEAEQLFQKPYKDVSADWFLFSRSRTINEEMEGNAEEGMLIAVPRKEVDSHLYTLKMAGLYPVRLDVGCIAMCNAFIKLKNLTEGKVICLVNVVTSGFDISIFDKNSYLYPRSIYPQNSLKQDFNSYLIANIQDSLRYCQFRLKFQPVEKIVFTGKIPLDAKFREFMKEALKTKVELWNPFESVNFKTKVSEKTLKSQGPIMTANLGLVI